MRHLFCTFLLIFCLLPALQAQTALEQCKLHIQQGELDAAIKSGTSAVKQNPNDPDAHRFLGSAYSRQGDLSNADTELSLAQTLYSDKLQAVAANAAVHQEYQRSLALTQRWLGEVRSHIGKPDEAIKCYDDALKNFEAIKVRPIQADILGYKADVVAETGDIPRVLDLYRQARSRAGIDGFKHPEMKIGQAWIYFLIQRIDRAIHLAKEAIQEADLPDEKALYRMTEGYFRLRAIQEGTTVQEGIASPKNASVTSNDVWTNCLLKGLNELHDREGNVHPGYNKRYEAIGLRYAGDITLADALSSKNPVETQRLLDLAKQRYQRSFDKAVELGARQELETCSLRLEEVKSYMSVNAPENRSHFFGGIDIGSTGIKPSLVELRLGGTVKAKPDTITDDRSDADKKDDNWNVVESGKSGIIPVEKIQQAIRAIRSQTAWMASKCANPEQITIVIACSSSMSRFSNLEAFRNVIIASTQAFKPRVEIIDSRQELLYDVIGVVPEGERFSAVLLDVGSGNGRFGYLDLRENILVQNFEIRYGTKELDKLVTSSRRPEETAGDALERLLLSEIDPVVGSAFTNYPKIKTKKSIYLTGGISWALTSYLHPESADKRYVELSRSDFKRFYQMMQQAGNAYPSPDLSGVPAPVLALAKKDIADVQKTFKPSNLVAGAGILSHLADDQLFVRDKIIFGRNLGWALGLARSTYAARK